MDSEPVSLPSRTPHETAPLLGADDCLRDIVVRHPEVIGLLISRGITPLEGSLTLAEAAARRHLRLPKLIAALEREIAQHHAPIAS